MALTGTNWVTVLSCTSILALSQLLLATTDASICPDRQYLNSKLQACVNCSECRDGTVVLRPCEIHRDTHCGPIVELLGPIHNHHRHHHQQRQRGHEDDDVAASEATAASPVRSRDEAVSSSEAPFSEAETLVWDWQAVALTSAVFTCILFFLVIAVYSLHQARQWRRLKENFEADVEELSARLSLMAAAAAADGNDEASSPPPKASADGVVGVRRCPSPDPTASYLNARCVYLEQLLSVRNGYKIRTLPQGNLYIEETKNSKA